MTAPELKGATEIIRGSHLWHGETIAGVVELADFSNRAAERETGNRANAIKMRMPSESLAITQSHQGNAWHRGGANRSDHPRLIVTPQCCVGLVRHLENMCLAMPREIEDKLPERVRELIGYSIHPPFMGHVDPEALAAGDTAAMTRSDE